MLILEYNDLCMIRAAMTFNCHRSNRDIMLIAYFFFVTLQEEVSAIITLSLAFVLFKHYSSIPNFNPDTEPE